nr:putative F-box domain-containing protein [Tanacetum cinerariifolium]
MKRLPVISLIRFRTVSKQWKSLIDSAKFIADHHVIQDHTQSQHHHRHLLLSCMESRVASWGSVNYNMHIMGKKVNELRAMLKLHEQTLPKSNAPALYAIRAGKVHKGLRNRAGPKVLDALGEMFEKCLYGNK